MEQVRSCLACHRAIPMLNLQGPVSVKLNRLRPSAVACCCFAGRTSEELYLNYSNLKLNRPSAQGLWWQSKEYGSIAPPRRAFGGRVRSTLQGLSGTVGGRFPILRQFNAFTSLIASFLTFLLFCFFILVFFFNVVERTRYNKHTNGKGRKGITTLLPYLVLLHTR